MNSSAPSDKDDAPAAVPNEALLERAFDTDSESFFDDPDIRQRLNLIRHLVQSTRLAILVSGAPEAGKTTCLDRLQGTADERWMLCRVAGSASAEADRVLGRVARCCDLPPDCGTPALRQLLAEHAATLTRNARLPVIAVDDAHALQREALAELAALSAGEEGWHLLLFAEPGHRELFEAAGLTAPGRLHGLEWPPFSEAQTGAYVLHRLHTAGWSGDLPFTVEQVRRLHRESAGLPGAINRLAPKLTARPGTATPKPRPRLPGRSPRMRNLLRGAAMLSVVAAVAVVLWQQERINALFEQPSAPTSLPADGSTDGFEPDAPREDLAAAPPGKPQPALPETEDDTTTEQGPALAQAPAAPVVPPAAPLPSDPTESAADPEPSQSPRAPAPEPSPDEAPEAVDPEPTAAAPVAPSDADAPPPQGPATDNAADTPRSDPATSTAPEPEPEPEPDPAPAQSVPTGDGGETDVPAAVGTPTVPASGPDTETASTQLDAADSEPDAQPAPATNAEAGAAWVLSRDPAHYTLQLLGSRELKPLHALMDRYDLHADTAWYKIRYQNADWYVLVHGDYADRRAASRAVGALPAGLRRAGPWPRPLAAVQEEVRRGYK